MFKNKLNFDFTYYNSNATNQLLETTISSNLGGLPTGSYFINAGKIRNTGFESSLSYKIFDNEKFGWTATVNASANKNTIVELFPTRLSIPQDQLFSLTGGGEFTKMRLGGSFGDLYGVKFKGMIRDVFW